MQAPCKQPADPSAAHRAWLASWMPDFVLPRLDDFCSVQVCTDCYFAHHFGAHEHEGQWYSGESDMPCQSGEPLRLIGDDVDVWDATCSDHANTTVTCIGCAGEGWGWWRSEAHLAGDENWHECELCEGTGSLAVPCPHCRSTDDDNGIDEFSWHFCQGCGSSLGGSRYRLSITERTT